MKKTIGGDRLGAGKKMSVDLHGYERSTHDLGYLWRSTMAAGTLVPFLCEVGLPGDTFDIDLEFDGKTHPTTGPLFGSYKVQLDVFQCPIRLYQGLLHNNKMGIGLKMNEVKLPTIRLKAMAVDEEARDIDNAQINPSCILSYLGIRGVGMAGGSDRLFNAVPLLAYWDIFKNYYANKQEENAYVIHKELVAVPENIEKIEIDVPGNGLWQLIHPYDGGVGSNVEVTGGWEVLINYDTLAPNLETIIFVTDHGRFAAADILTGITDNGSNYIQGFWNVNVVGNLIVYAWDYLGAGEEVVTAPRLVAFPLENLDTMRERILQAVLSSSAFSVNDNNIAPFTYLLDTAGDQTAYTATQEGLAVKTYQSDVFNNWINTDWIDGTNGINEVTAIDTTGDSFEIPALLLARKVYDMLNRIAISGGTYDDWLDAVYTHERYVRMETPIYCGGLIREMIFQEVVSNAEAKSGVGQQPLGTLAGKGVMAQKKKGGRITVKVDEPSYIMGIVSLTPRVDYSQGNKWDVNLKTLDDLHKPGLDEIGFQDLIAEQMAWWTTYHDGSGWKQVAVGKQPAWMNYMTNVNQTRGNFAIQDNEMFMTLNRRYERIDFRDADITTYIDPVKFNNSFAQTSLDAQNFWAQIAVDITARRKMSAKIMPNL